MNGSGNMVNFASDSGSQSWASWDESLSGKGGGGAATGVSVPDTTLDPNGTLGIFDLNITQGSTTTTQVYCIAISVDKATKSTTQGRLACIDASGQSPEITILSESD